MRRLASARRLRRAQRLCWVAGTHGTRGCRARAPQPGAKPTLRACAVQVRDETVLKLLKEGGLGPPDLVWLRKVGWPAPAQALRARVVHADLRRRGWQGRRTTQPPLHQVCSA